MSKLIDTDLLLKQFFEEPNKWFHVRELARLVKLNATTVSKYLTQFTKEGFLTKNKERGHLLFRANTESHKYKDAKIYNNIKSIKNSGLIEHLEKELHYPETIILFGSYSKGENDRNSDMDLFIITNKKKEINLSQYEKKLKTKIQTFIKTKGEFYALQKENKHLVNSILNGTVLKGYTEVFR